MLCFVVFAIRLSPSPAVPSPSRLPVRPPLSSNSHGIISFADPHPLNSFVSYRYKNAGGEGLRPFHVQTFQGVSTYPLLFQILAHSFALFCAFLHSNKTQLFSFQAFPHSFPKTCRYPHTPYEWINDAYSSLPSAGEDSRSQSPLRLCPCELRVLCGLCVNSYPWLCLSPVDCRPPRISLLLYILTSLLLSFSHEGEL